MGGRLSISNMINIVRKRPGMYLGSNSITALWHFIDGYRFAERDFSVCRKGKLFPLPYQYMYEYTGYRLKCHDTSGWCNQILRACDGDEEAALWKFFEIYDDFNQIKMRKYWKAVLSGDNIAWNNRMERAYSLRPKVSGSGPFVLDEQSTVKEPVYNDPLFVYVIELTIPAYILAVETANEIQLDGRFFMSLEKVKERAEVYFGPIDCWEEFNGSNLSFDKNIVT